MHSVSLQLPMNASEAGTLAGLIFQQAEGRRLDGDLRNRLGARVQALRLASLAPFAGSLQQDPIHPATYYLAADTRGVEPQPLLLRLALASSPSSGLFPNSVLIGRMRTSFGHEVVVNAIRFGPADRENIRTFAERVDPAFLPRPQGASPSISVEQERLEASLPGAFEAYRDILRSTGANLAAVPVSDQAQVDTVVWAAIRSGWREGYALEYASDSPDHAPSGCTRFSVHAPERLEELEALLDRLQAPSRRNFDLELAFDRDRSNPEAIASFLQFLRSRGKAAQFVRPHPDAIDRLGQISEVARQHGALPAIRSAGLLPSTVLQQIGRATAGKVSYRISKPGPVGGNAGHILKVALENLRV